MKKYFIIISMLMILQGCTNAKILQGSTPLPYSIAEQRDARKNIKIDSQLPVDAVILGPVETSRCHRNTLETEPTEDMILQDLRVIAYSQGADGLIDVKINKRSGLLGNCWYILDGKAIMYTSKN